jgi:hypothetical protein
VTNANRFRTGLYLFFVFFALAMMSLILVIGGWKDLCLNSCW